jgi:glycosyltransferase involved in cell wall biosynthesis
MRILHVIDSGGFYGAENMLLSLAGEQQQLGLEPVLISIGTPASGEKPIEREAVARGIPLECFRMRPGPNFTGALEILRFARRTGSDLFHTHGYKANILFGLLPRGMRRLPVVATVHGWTCLSGWNRMRLYEWLLRSCPEEKVVVISNGLAPHVREETPDPAIMQFIHGGTTIGAVGRLSPEKGFNVLLEAFWQLACNDPQVRLLILGEGQERSRLEEIIRNKGLGGRVLIPGYRPVAGRYIASFSVFVLPSLSEGLPLVLLEAQQAQVPIVASRVGGVPEVLDQGAAGILVSAGEPEELSKAIRRVLEDKDSAGRRANRGVFLFKSRYTARAMALKYFEVYKGLPPAENNCRLGPEQH